MSGFIWLSLAVLLLWNARATWGRECDATALCPSDPCTISRTVELEFTCYLDFSGKDVTIAPEGRLLLHPRLNEIGDLTIEARNLTVRGSIELSKTFASFYVTGDFRTARQPGRGAISIGTSVDRLYSFGYLSIEAGENVVLAGGRLSVITGESSVEVFGRNIEVVSDVFALSGAAEAAISLDASETIRTGGRLRVGAGEYGSGRIQLSTGSGDVVVDGSLETRRTATYVIVDAGRNVTVNGRIRVNSADSYGNGDVSVDARGDIAIPGKIEARGYGRAGSAGIVQLKPGSSGNVSITGTIDGRGPATSSYSAGILIGPACRVALAGRLLSNGPEYTDGNVVTYRESLDVTGASLIAEPEFGGNNVSCRCIDSNADQVCDGGCVAAPTGLDAATVHPAAVITPRPMTPCS